MKQQKIENFDPNAPSQDNAGVFGLPFNAEESEIILVPVPWEATVSYGSGASEGPGAIYNASFQVDLCHHDFPDLWKRGIFMEAVPDKIVQLNKELKPAAANIINALVQGRDTQIPEFKDYYEKVNNGCEEMNEWVAEQVAFWRSKGKKTGLVGGDHSVPLGGLRALSKEYRDFGLLVIDAHMDFRDAYEGFTYSHASIFRNVLNELPQVSKLVQVGIRDYCQEERDFANRQGNRTEIFFFRDLRNSQYDGKSWKDLCNDIVGSLPDKVYISVDIDGLDPKLCPNTGTPVPGGLEYEELIYLLNTLKKSNKEVIGFDLCEVSPGETEWDGNVGARLLFHLCGLL